MYNNPGNARDPTPCYHLATRDSTNYSRATHDPTSYCPAICDSTDYHPSTGDRIGYSGTRAQSMFHPSPDSPHAIAHTAESVFTHTSEGYHRTCGVGNHGLGFVSGTFDYHAIHQGLDPTERLQNEADGAEQRK
ncbi:hypothetical protein NMY22_g3009 [Coprinellus aureogranulatus]|nr:hypothetical protein NMY22_g3009 [Coprinellus aureogranulatus]